MTLDLKRIGLGLGLVTAATTASATNPLLVYCSNCSPSQIDTLVLNTSAAQGTIIYVGDLVTGAIGAYSVYSDIDDSKHPPVRVKYVDTVPTDATITSGVTASIQFYKFSPVGWNKHFDIVYNGPNPTGTTAWTISNDGPDQMKFNAWLNTPGSGAKTAAQLAGIVTQTLAIVTKADPATVPKEQAEVDFADGSHTTAVQDFSSGMLKDDPNSSIDGEGNRIPYADAAGHVHNTGGIRKYNDDYQGTKDYDSWLNQITHFNVLVQTPGGTQIGGGGSSGGGGVQPVICTETVDDEGRKVEACFAG